MPPAAARDIGPMAYYDSDEDSSDEDNAMDDGGCFFWSFDDEVRAMTRRPVQEFLRVRTTPNAPTQIDPRLADFRIDWGLKQSELERHFNLYPHEVKQLRAASLTWRRRQSQRTVDLRR